MDLLQINSLSKSYSGVAALRGVDLSLASGSIVALIGPNGAGKSTLLGCVAGAIVPDNGSICFAGRNIAGRGSAGAARAGIARTFQNVRLFGHLTALQNVMVGGHRHARSGLLEDMLHLGRHAGEERTLTAEAFAALSFAGVASVAQRAAGTLSVGEQRLVEFARAMAARPQLMLLDEPASGLNTGETAAFAALLRKAQASGMTILVVDHDMDLIGACAEHVVVLDFGTVIATGTFADVQRNQRVRDAYFGVAETA